MNNTIRAEIKKRITDIALKSGISDSKNQKVAESIAKKYGISLVDVYVEQERQMCEALGYTFKDEKSYRIMLEEVLNMEV